MKPLFPISIKIQIFGPAIAYDDSGSRITSVKTLRSLDGITHPDDTIGNYFQHGEILDNAGVSGGTVGLAYNSSKRRIEVVCTFQATHRLKAGERKQLLSATAGQLSDGIGEGSSDPVPGHSGNLLTSPRQVRGRRFVLYKRSRQEKFPHGRLTFGRARRREFHSNIKRSLVTPPIR